MSEQSSWLRHLGIDPRAFRALTAALILMDLRGQHYAKSTGVKPREVLSPLVCVLGQCLLMSAIASLVLFLRVDVFLFAFVGLTTTLLVIASAVVVEFQEVVLDPRDSLIVAPRPVSGRTYAAARLCNLLFYILTMWGALSIFPTIIGAALYDAGPWFAPAYLVASLTISLLAAGAVILLLTLRPPARGLDGWQEILAWTQVVLLMVIGYGGQLMFRRKDYAVELFSAFPARWVDFTPSGWLARWVESAAVAPTGITFGIGATLIFGTALAGAGLVQWLARLYEGVHPLGLEARAVTVRMSRVGQLTSGLPRLIARNSGERVGFWMTRSLLGRDAGLRMRCLYSLNMVVAVVILGLGTRQFADPRQASDLSLVMLPLLSVYLTSLSVPTIVFNMAYVRDHDASWRFATAPLDPPVSVGIGLVKAVQWYLVTPVSVLLAGVYWWAWGDVGSALLHAVAAWSLSWPLALASLWLALPAFPFSRPPARGGSLGPVAIPLAAFSAVLMFVAAAHYAWCGSIWFWIVGGVACVVASLVLRPLAARRFQSLIERTL
ncbi:MAG: hypothetical protein ACKV2Q_13580 [Planctomycetaceae bacterium]